MVLDWFGSFLVGRSYAVTFKGQSTQNVLLDVRVSQGSVLGPVPFSLYVADVVSLVLGCGISVHMYADDLLIYFSDCLVNVSFLTDRLMDCIVAVGRWLSVNQLKFNPRKTEFLWLGTGPSLKNMDAPTLLVDGVEVSPALIVRDLGVVLDGC